MCFYLKWCLLEFSVLLFVVTCGSSAPGEKESRAGAWLAGSKDALGALEEMFLPSCSAFGRAGTASRGTEMLLGTIALPAPYNRG